MPKPKIRNIRPKSNAGYGSLLHEVEVEERAIEFADWRPEPLPLLCSAGIKNIIGDYETKGRPGVEGGGLKWWDGAEPIGLGLWYPDGTPEGRYQYVAWGHEAEGPQHDAATVKRWMEREIRDLTWLNHTMKFEGHISREIGIDLEAQNVWPQDIAHTAALLDDHRRRFSLEVLVRDLLGDTGEEKIHKVRGWKLDPTKMATYPPGMVAERAIGDVRQVRLLHDRLWPDIIKEGLLNVHNLEDSVIYPVCEMEKNALPIDVDRLAGWVIRAQADSEECQYRIKKLTGLQFKPDTAHWTELFRLRGLDHHEHTPSGKHLSFTGLILKSYAERDEAVKLGLRMSKLQDVLTKFLIKYQRTVGSDHLLRFALHQLRSESGDKGEAESEGELAGTGSGRFSSSAIKIGKEKIGTNIQQVMTPDKQLEEYDLGDDYIVRELITGGEDPDTREPLDVISADAMQIEYRIFASYANNPKVIDAYQADLRYMGKLDKKGALSFHKLIWGYLKEYKADLGYKSLKNLNFCRIYGGGVVKLALMMGYITFAQFEELNRIEDYREKIARPELIEANHVIDIYDREIPEVKPLLREASRLAETRGWVQTIEGRRVRFQRVNGRILRPHKAFNGVAQGGAADIMKKKIVETHRERKHTGFIMRATNHDELLGSARQRNTAQLLCEILDRQTTPRIKVPILWDVGQGKNWRAAKEDK